MPCRQSVVCIFLKHHKFSLRAPFGGALRSRVQPYLYGRLGKTSVVQLTYPRMILDENISTDDIRFPLEPCLTKIPSKVVGGGLRGCLQASVLGGRPNEVEGGGRAGESWGNRRGAWLVTNMYRGSGRL